jgi:hypothetical protein
VLLNDEQLSGRMKSSLITSEGLLGQARQIQLLEPVRVLLNDEQLSGRMKSSLITSEGYAGKPKVCLVNRDKYTYWNL